MIFGFWYDCIKPKYWQNANLFYMDTDSFIIYIKTKDVYKDIVNDAGKRFHSSDGDFHRPLPKDKNKKVIK